MTKNNLHGHYNWPYHGVVDFNSGRPPLLIKALTLQLILFTSFKWPHEGHGMAWHGMAWHGMAWHG